MYVFMKVYMYVGVYICTYVYTYVLRTYVFIELCIYVLWTCVFKYFVRKNVSMYVPSLRVCKCVHVKVI